MNTQQALTHLGGLSAAQFMQRHWQRKPLLVRQAFAGFKPLLSRDALFALAGVDGVESRLIQGDTTSQRWQLRHGPFTRRQLPALKQAAWTLLVQGVDLHHDGVAQLLQKFRFVPDARLDDLMISYASDGGGVGPHFDSYDVFLLQAQGRRRWRISGQRDLRLLDGLPLKILANFQPTADYLLEPGDMLYLPPGYAHDGVAEGGDCMTYSVGFRVPSQADMGRELLQRLAEEAMEPGRPVLYQDRGHAATAHPAAIPAELLHFAREALERAVQDPVALRRALGESLTEPKAHVWFETGRAPRKLTALALDRRSRMMYDQDHIYLNGESWLARGADARLMRQLADARALNAKQVASASVAASQLLREWVLAGWVRGASSEAP